MLQAVTPRPLVCSCQSPLLPSAYSRARPRVETLPFGRREHRPIPGDGQLQTYRQGNPLEARTG